MESRKMLPSGVQRAALLSIALSAAVLIPHASQATTLGGPYPFQKASIAEMQAIGKGAGISVGSVVVSGTQGAGDTFEWKTDGAVTCNAVSGGGDGGTTFCGYVGSTVGSGYRLNGYWKRQGITDTYYSTWFNAATSGTADSHAALQNMLNAAVAANIPVINFVGPAVWNYTPLVIPAMTAGQTLTFTGTAALNCGDPTTGLGNTNCIYTAAHNVGNLVFDGTNGFKIYGDWRIAQSQNTGEALIQIYGGTCDSVTVKNMEVAYSRNFLFQVLCPRQKVTDNFFHDSARDMYNGSGSTDIYVAGNTCVGGGDDCIAMHVENNSATARAAVTITGNKCIDTYAIKYIGPKGATITGNQCYLNKTYSYAAVVSATEGKTAALATTITDNHSIDPINAVAFGGTNVAPVGMQFQFYGSAGSGTLPGTSNGAGIVSPLAFNYTLDNTGTTTVSPGEGIIIDNNTIIKTQTAAASYSALPLVGELKKAFPTTYCMSQGMAFMPTGCQNPAITDAELTGSGMVFISGGYLWHAQIKGNYIATGGYGIYANGLCGNNNSTRDVDISGNHFSNSPSGGVVFACATTTNMDVRIKDNHFDIDPLFTSPQHNANGTWLNTGALSAIDLYGTVGIEHCDNDILNTYFPWRAGNGSVDYKCGMGEILHGVPAAVNIYNASNKGIGFFYTGNQYIAQNQDGTSATYGQMFASWASVGTDPSGTALYHYAGEFMRNANAVCNGTTGVPGWYAITTGNANVLNTDYRVSGTC